MKRLAKLGMVTGAPGMAALDMNSAEDAVVKHTREIVPGMVICGMEVMGTAAWTLHAGFATAPSQLPCHVPAKCCVWYRHRLVICLCL